MEFSRAQLRLLDAALEAFAENGYSATSTREIAARAGRSPAAVYVHYPSKEELLFAVSLMGHQDALAALKTAANSATDPVERLHVMVFEFSAWHICHAKRGRVVQYEFHAMTPEHRKQVVAVRRQFQALMVEVLNDGVQAGVFDIDAIPDAARALLSLCVDLVRWFDPSQTRNPNRIARSNADLALRMVGASPITDPAARTETPRAATPRARTAPAVRPEGETA